MKLLWVFIGILLFLIVAYVLDFLGTIFNFVWGVFNSVGINQPEIGFDYKSEVFAPVVATFTGLATFLTVFIIATAIKQRKT